jgi:hypothetical protein
MIIDGKAMAPHFGTWQVTDERLPTMGVVVLGLGWHKSGMPVVQFVEWRIVEDWDERDEYGDPLYDKDKLFSVSDGDTEADACWFVSFGNESGDDALTIHSPPLWAECKFAVGLPVIVLPQDDEE